MKHLKLYEEFTFKIGSEYTTKSSGQITKTVELPKNIFYMSKKDLLKEFGEIDEFVAHISSDYVIDFIFNNPNLKITASDSGIRFHVNNYKIKLSINTINNESQFNIKGSDGHSTNIFIHESRNSRDIIYKILDFVFERNVDVMYEFIKHNKRSSKCEDVANYYLITSYIYQKDAIDKGELYLLKDVKIHPKILEEYPEVKDIKKQSDWS